MEWVINIGGGYGAFLFNGTEAEAEDMRKHKANWEQAVAIKREADLKEVAEQKPKQCWNHPNFKHVAKGFRYVCDCCEVA